MNPAPLLSGFCIGEQESWYYLYLLRSKKNSKKIYIGCTRNIKKRLEEHREGKSYHTRKMLPVELLYAELFKSRKDAFEREKKLKYHGSALRNLKIRLKSTLNGGAG